MKLANDAANSSGGGEVTFGDDEARPAWQRHKPTQDPGRGLDTWQRQDICWKRKTSIA